MNHAKLETYYRIFDASIVPVCAGGCARLTEALAARLGRKVTDTASRSWGAPQRQGASDGARAESSAPLLTEVMRAVLLISLVAPTCCLHAGSPRRPRTQPAARMTAAAATRIPVVSYEQVTIASPSEGPPAQEITVVDLMPYINSALEASGMRDGSVNLISRHTTTAITINEWESRLVSAARWSLRPDNTASAQQPEPPRRCATSERGC